MALRPLSGLSYFHSLIHRSNRARPYFKSLQNQNRRTKKQNVQETNAQGPEEGDGTESRGTGRSFGAPAGFGVLNARWDGPAANGTLLRSLQPLQRATQGPGVGPKGKTELAK